MTDSEALINDEACLYALRLSEKGFDDAYLARQAGCTVEEIRHALDRGLELREAQQS